MTKLNKPDTLSTEDTETDSGREITLALFIPPDSNAFDGHFTDHPMLPGVTQIHWAIEYASEHGLACDVNSVDRLKFMRPITPDMQLSLTLHIDHEHTCLSFSYQSPVGIHSSGLIKLKPSND